MCNSDMFDKLPSPLEKHFMLKGRDLEGAGLMLDIIKSRKKGVFYDRDISVRIYSYIIARREGEYISLARYIDIHLQKYGLKNYVDGVDDIITMLLESLADENGRKWFYDKISFRAFTRHAVDSLLLVLVKKKNRREQIIDVLPPCEDENEETEICNFIELSKDTTQLQELLLEQNDKANAFYVYLQKQDPMGYKVLKLRVEGYNCSEIAKKLRISEAEVYNVNKRISRIAVLFYPDAK